MLRFLRSVLPCLTGARDRSYTGSSGARIFGRFFFHISLFFLFVQHNQIEHLGHRLKQWLRNGLIDFGIPQQLMRDAKADEAIPEPLFEPVAEVLNLIMLDEEEEEADVEEEAAKDASA